MRHFTQLRQKRKDDAKLRAMYGLPCPQCLAAGVAAASVNVLLPQFRCNVCSYLDPRPSLTLDQKRKAGMEFR